MRKTAWIMMLVVLCCAFALTACGTEEAEEAASISVAGTVENFEAVDLDGNTVKMEDLFAQNKVTMVNLWGTFCGPCINEMPELAEMAPEFQEQGGAVVGLVVDVYEKDPVMIDVAKGILKDTGVGYLNLCYSAQCEDNFPAEAVPTTYFVNSKGEVLGDPIVGASPEAYRTRMAECLASAGETNE